ncbi:hypothetical protein PENSPDRAFT_156226 [Peniophora sp. CONT]|nr:hypothetical protein PENSPDRAFT_156226 [Peniophora sp. CONT]
MTEIRPRDSPFMQNLREGPTSALEHLRALYQTRAPEPIAENDELSRCAQDLLVHFAMPSDMYCNPNMIALTIKPELCRACFDAKILFLFADMMADPDFLRHYSMFTFSIARCTLILLHVWFIDMMHRSVSRALMTPLSAMAFFEVTERACSVMWDERHRANVPDLHMIMALVELQGVFHTIYALQPRYPGLGNAPISPAMVKITVYFWVYNYTHIVGDETEHYHRLSTGGYEDSIDLFLYLIEESKGEGEEEYIDTTASQTGQRRALTEILQDIGADSILRTMRATLRYSKHMTRVPPRVRDCLLVCRILYLEHASFRGIYLQMPMIEDIAAVFDAPIMHLPPDRDPAQVQPVLEAYRSAWNHLSFVGTACKSGSMSPSLINPVSIWNIMVKSVTMVLELDVEWHNDPANPNLEQITPFLVQFQATLLETFASVWLDGLRASRNGEGGFPDSIVTGLANVDGASAVWYGFIETAHARFDSGIITSSPISYIVRVWRQFGKVLGFDEGSERVRATHICAWILCTFHTTPSSKPLMVCKGCREKRYCSSACQRSDWKQGGHRVRCRRLKA